MKHVFIIGSRGLPATYGGFETFVENLVSKRNSKEIVYHVACLSDKENHSHFDYKGADCFTIKAPKLGPARVIAYDMMAINYALTIIKQERIQKPIFYILGNTIGAFMGPFARKIHKLGGVFYINPDGLEWKRAKWPKPVQAYLKYAEKQMTRYADLVICDNKGIEEYIQESYPWAQTSYIAYGTEVAPSVFKRQDHLVREWYDKWGIREKKYFLILGRFVPENNYESMIHEFMKSQTSKDLVIITNYQGNGYFETLKKATNFESDPRIKFVGTVYDQELLKYIRKEAFAYIHGHEVGGTNPGLLEALSMTDLNLILDVSFNKRVALDSVLYWKKDDGDLGSLIDIVNLDDAQELGPRAKRRIEEAFTWQKIISEYEELFLS